MAKSDVVVNKYFNVSEHFCDFINGVLFAGKEVLEPENLYEKSVDSRLSIPQKKGYVRKSRDSIMKGDFHGIYSIFAVESQENIHYGMPVRVMLYDAMEYAQQIEVLKRQHKECKDLKESDEFLSGMSKEDQLIPVFTLVFYYGEKPWDGSKNLKEMFLLPDELKDYEDYLPEYPIHVICPKDVNPENFRTEWKEIFEILKRNGDSKQLIEYAEKHRETLKNWDVETKEFVMTLMKGKQVWDEMEDKEEVNMCEAFRQLMEMGRVEGREEGIKEGREEGVRILILDNLEEGKSQQVILQKLNRRYNMDEDTALMYYEQTLTFLHK